jgi:hypothetical protein
MRCLLLLALLAGVVAGKSVHLGTAPAALQAPRRELRQSVNCAKCKPSYGMRMRMAGKCEATVCLWFQARGAKDSTSMWCVGLPAGGLLVHLFGFGGGASGAHWIGLAPITFVV